MNLDNNIGFKKLSEDSQKDIRKMAKESTETVVKQEIECRLLGGDY
jgi:hypothetical protein